ncbi:MAG: single-stranded DNA-binding protein [Bacteroidales bacterium]|nr:single-stranded DNA-binding protein [Bacteroidales bacterium]
MGTLENSVQLIGRPGMDPEVRNVGNRKNVRFSLATNDYAYNENHELERTTSWHNIVAWGKIAEQAEKYIKKGKQIALEGRLKTRVYEKDGKKNYFTEITMNEFLLIDRSSNDEQDQSGDS